MDRSISQVGSKNAAYYDDIGSASGTVSADRPGGRRPPFRRATSRLACGYGTRLAGRPMNDAQVSYGTVL